jgi:hypothetical protein
MPRNDKTGTGTKVIQFCGSDALRGFDFEIDGARSRADCGFQNGQLFFDRPGEVTVILLTSASGEYNGLGIPGKQGTNSLAPITGARQVIEPKLEKRFTPGNLLSDTRQQRFRIGETERGADPRQEGTRQHFRMGSPA